MNDAAEAVQTKQNSRSTKFETVKTWLMGAALAAFVASGVDVFLHDEKKEKICSDMQKDFDAAAMPIGTSAEKFLKDRNGYISINVKVDKNESGHFMPTAMPSCFLELKFK